MKRQIRFSRRVHFDQDVRFQQSQTLDLDRAQNQGEQFDLQFQLFDADKIRPGPPGGILKGGGLHRQPGCQADIKLEVAIQMDFKAAMRFNRLGDTGFQAVEIIGRQNYYGGQHNDDTGQNDYSQDSFPTHNNAFLIIGVGRDCQSWDSMGKILKNPIPKRLQKPV